MGFLIELGDHEIPARLLGLKPGNDLLGLGDPVIVRVKRHEIVEGGDGLTGRGLVVLGGLGLFFIGQSFAKQGFGGDGRAVVVAIRRQFVGLRGQDKVLLFLAGGADLQLGLRGDFAVGAALDNLAVEAAVFSMLLNNGMKL